MKKGFTLIEMMCVIVIVSLLSLVVLPTIINQYSNKKEEISEVTEKIIIDAAELYARETGETYQNITLNDLVEDGKLEKPIKDYKTGKEISLSKKIKIDATGNACVIGIGGCEKIEYNDYKNGEVLYYNPVDGENCRDAYNSATSTTGTNTGCMKWHAFNDSPESKTVNLILDHNTTALVAWNSTGTNTEMNEVKAALDSDTKNWKEDARLITADELAKIIGVDEILKWDSKKTYKHSDANKEQYVSWYVLDGPSNIATYSSTDGWQKQVVSSTKISDYAWLYNNTYCTGCSQSATDTKGYWTSTPTTGYSNYAWDVDKGGYINRSNVTTNNWYGVRPVITVKKQKFDS